jgi:Putative beta-barrel porin 2
LNARRFFTALSVATGFAQTALIAADRVVQITQIAEAVKGVPQQPASVIEDLGDIRPLADKSLLKRLRLTASTSTEFVSNALSVGNHGSGDFLLHPSISAAFDQPIDDAFSLSFNARSESFLYSKFDESSFWGFGGSVFLNYQPTKDSVRFCAGIEPYWYASVRTGDQLSEALGVSGGVQKEWTFNRDRTVFFIGYHFSRFFSFPAADDRNAHRVTVGLTHNISQSLYGQLYYSYQYSDYTGAPRHDSRNLVGLNLVHRINNRWSANATAYLVDNDSTASRATYQTAGTGLGVSCQF